MNPPSAPLDTGEAPLFIEGQSFVYRAFDRSGEILYVGVTDDICRRLTQHERLSRSWWWKVGRVTWERYATRTQAEHAEVYLIRSLVPLHNHQHNERRTIAAGMGHRRLYDSQAWARLGLLVRAEREAARRTQTSMAADAGIKIEAWRAFERAEFTDWDPGVLNQVEKVMSWHRGSIEEVLAGGEPNRLTEAERVHRALGQGRLQSVGDRL